MADKSKLTSFILDNESHSVQFVETLAVKEGVECDTYSFIDNKSKDLAIVRVQGGYKTPLQLILSGSQTIEGFISGQGTLTIQEQNGESKKYSFKDGDNKPAIPVTVGQIMQWEADKNSGIIFYELCYPPYKDGRFKNFPE